MKARLFAAAKIAVTVFLFFYIFRNIDFHQFRATIRNARLDILILGFAVIWIAHYICIFRWKMLMRPLMPVLGTARLFGIYCIGLFFNLAFPTVVGGDVVKMYYAGRPSKMYAQSFAATFLDRDTGMLAMLIIACAALLIHPVALPGIPVSLVIWSVLAAFVAGNIAIFTPFFHRRVSSLLHKLRMAKIAGKIDMISSAFQVMGKNPALLFGALLISFVNQLLVISVSWIMAIGLRLQLSPAWFLVFVPVITLISMIPISLNGMGLREYAFLSLFGAIGIAPESCIALGLMSSIVVLLSSLPGGIVYIFLRNRNEIQQLTAIKTEIP